MLYREDLRGTGGLNEGIIERDTNVRLYGRTSMNLTYALAHSNNLYFANIGTASRLRQGQLLRAVVRTWAKKRV